ncbi:MAG: hypothetical protein ACPGWR_29025 [Ardenticatenaceae bacterium]
MTLYDYLGLEPTCTPQEVRQAFEARRLQLEIAREKAHSAANRARVEVEWRAIHAAWDVLGNPKHRRAYQRQLRQEEKSATDDSPTERSDRLQLGTWLPLILLIMAGFGFLVPWQNSLLLLIWVTSLFIAAAGWLWRFER